MVSSKIKKVNKKLVLFESSLFVGLVGFLFESLVRNLNISFYLRVVFVMVLFGGLFSVFFTFIEPFFQRVIFLFLKRRSSSYKLFFHIVLFIVLFVLYSLVYFGVSLF